MSPLKRDPWRQLASGIYVPPLLHRFPGYPCGGCGVQCEHTCLNGCSGCWPQQLELEADGFSGGSCCADVDTGGVPLIADASGGGGSCFWVYDYPTDICFVHRIEIDMVFDELGDRVPAGHYYIHALYRFSNLNPIHRFLKDFGTTKPDCEEWAASPIVLPWFEDFSACDGSGVTFTIKAIL